MACCNIDVWGIALNILLQDAPFLTFRLLIIVHYKIITYMNIFFTCKSVRFVLSRVVHIFYIFASSFTNIHREHTERQKYARDTAPAVPAVRGKLGKSESGRHQAASEDAQQGRTISKPAAAEAAKNQQKVRQMGMVDDG